MAKKKEKEAGAPIWMVTMSDMNTLLMTFFIILFSMMVQDERLYMDLKDIFKDMSNWANPTAQGPRPNAPEINTLPEGDQSGSVEKDASRQEIPRPKHLSFQITKRGRRTVIHLNRKVGYEKGVFQLSAEQKETLDWVKAYMEGYQQNVVVMGYTDSTYDDAYVLDGDRLRPATATDESPDHFLLSSLRAQEVRRYLTSGAGELDHRQIRVGEGGAKKPPTGPYSKDHNRRVEIIISSRLGSPSR